MLHLTGKGSILDAIGGALNTGANAVVAGAKDVGDLGSLGVANLTGNQQAAANARAALANNTSNLSGESFGGNLGGLSADVGLTAAARAALAIPIGASIDIGNATTGGDLTQEKALEGTPFAGAERFASNNNKVKITSPRALAGNTIMTGVNVATLGKGKAAEQLVEKGAGKLLGDSVAAKAAARVAGSAGAGGAYGFGQGTGNAVGTAQTPGEAVSDIVKPTLENAAIVGGIGGLTTLPSVVRDFNSIPKTEAGSVGPEVNNAPVPAPEPIPVPDEALPATPQEAPPAPTNEPIGPEPSPQELAAATQNLHADMQDPGVDWAKVQGANAELAQTTNSVAKEMQQQDRMQQQMEGPTDLYKQIKAAGRIGPNDFEDIPSHLKNKTAQSMDHVAKQLGFADSQALHDAIITEEERRGKTPTPLKSMEEYRAEAKQYIADNPQGFDNVTRRAEAETHHNQFQAADKGTGYDKAKWQIPKGAPANKFIQALWDKTHSPEFEARNAIGAQLGATRDTMAMTKANLRDAQIAFDEASKKGVSPADREVARQNKTDAKASHVFVKGQEQLHSLAYRRAAEALDAAHPDITLGAKKGVRLTSNQQQFETARPTQPEASVKVRAGKEPEDPMATIRARVAEKPAYEGQNLNEGAFSTEDRAQLEADNKLQEAQQAEPRSIEGDHAVMNKIDETAGKASNEDLVKSYMDATPGADEATAKKAIGIIESDPRIDVVGRQENNTLHGEVASPEIGMVNPRGVVRVLAKSGNYVRTKLIQAAMRRAIGGRAWVDYLEGRAKQEFDKLAPEDQALADKSRLPGISREELAQQAKDPKAFADFIKRTDYIQNYRAETRRLYNPGDDTLYRKNFGASLHAANPEDLVRAPSTPKEIPTSPEEDSRHYHSYEDLEAATGRVRTTKNFMEDISKDVAKHRYDTTQRNLYHGLKQAFGEDNVSFGDTYNPQHVPLKDFSDIRAEKTIADKIDSRQMHEYSANVGGQLAKLYDSANNALKTTKLSTGFFHHINIDLSAFSLSPKVAAGAARAAVDPQFFLDSMDKWEANGTLEKYLSHGGTLGGGPEFESGINKVPIIKQLHASLFQREIPFAKVGIFEEFANKDMDPTTTEGAAKLTRVAGISNDIFGGANRMLNSLPAKTFKVVGRFVLAADYNEGQIRTLMAAITKGGTDGHMARQMIAGRAAILAAPGTVQAVMNGQIGDNPKDITKHVLRQLADPTVQTGWKTPGGNPKEISGLATVTNKAYRAIAPAFNKNNPDKASGFKSELTGNEAALPSVAQAELNNKDFYGNPMHGKGLSTAETVGQLAGTVEPIAGQPAARALEGTRLGKNVLVKSLAGGQSAISPGEAAVDISGIGRVKANPDAPAMQIMNNRQLIAESLKGDEQAQAGLYAIHPSWDQNLTKQQQADIYNNPNYEGNKWAALQNPTTFAALKKQNDFAVAHNNPGDPLFALSPKDQKIILEYKKLTAVDPGSDANDSAAVMFANNKDLITKYEQDVGTYSAAENKLYQSSGGLQGSNAPAITPGGVPYPAILNVPANQALLQKYFNITDSTTRQQFLTDNPSVSQMFEADYNFKNAQRASMNEPLLKDYPQAPAGLQTWINRYIAAPKAGRTTLRNANMDNFNAMQNYFATVDEYNLAKTAGQAKFQGTNLSQANLGQIYNLGHYDINPVIGADGKTIYSVDPEAAYASGGSGSGSKGSSSAYANLKAANQHREAVSAVKYAGKGARIKIKSQANARRRLFVRAHAKNTFVAKARPRVAIKAKSVSVV